jgi:tetratricopeptide (TPR) repeat protein
LIKEEALLEASTALKNMGHHELALTQCRKGLEINPRNLTFRREEAFNLNRLGRVDEAIIKIESLLAEMPPDTETIAYLGRIYKEMWVDSWKWIPEQELRLRTAFDSYHWLLKSFQTYLRGYRLDLNEFYPGVNAHTLGTIIIHLADLFEDKTHPDPDIQEVRDLIGDMRGALVFSLESITEEDTADYWSYISLGELRVLTAEIPQQVSRAYRKALTASRRNRFFLLSSLQQLEILRSLDIRREFVQAGIDVIEDELRRIDREIQRDDTPTKKRSSKTPPDQLATEQDGMVFLFAGYMIDHPGKQESHFPPEQEEDIRDAIAAILDKYNAGPDDLAVTSGMEAGSTLLFVECCVERGIPVQAYFPRSEAAYVREFVHPGGDHWVERFYRMRNHPLVSEFYQPDCVGQPKAGDNANERNNRWALYSALGRGIDKVRLIAFWDSKGGVPVDPDARLVKHMVDLMRDTGGIVELFKLTKGEPLVDGKQGTRSRGKKARRKRQQR